MKTFKQTTAQLLAERSHVYRQNNSRRDLEMINRELEQELSHNYQAYGPLKVTWAANMMYLGKFPSLVDDSDYYSLHKAFCLIACPFPKTFSKKDKLSLIGMYSGYLHVQKGKQALPQAMLRELFYIFMRERYFLGAQTVFSKLAPDLPEFQDLKFYGLKQVA